MSRTATAKDVASGAPLAEPAPDADALWRALETIAGCQEALVERLYEDFFARCPEARPLFGVYAIAEREEMVAETLRSIVALHEGEPWLEGNLEALGRSHEEYGVTSSMYPIFVESFVASVGAAAGVPLDEAAQTALRSAIAHVTERMRVAGEASARPT
ncbi:MAG: globin [Spirochaetaceae bacterium]|nr:globin [Myxococcales bacterium]MCB9722425.1 globin [Spirochaetaceae bacterium]